MKSRLSFALQQMLLSPRFLPICFAAFVAVRLALLLIPLAPPSSDAGWYLARAITLAAQHSYSQAGIPTAYWPVGYPAFLALLFKVTGPSLLAVRLANFAFSACTFWFLYLVTRKMLRDELAARGSVLLLTVYLNNAAYVPLVLTETIYTFLLLCASVFLLTKRTWLFALLAGLILGLATLVKTQTILLTPVLACVTYLDEWSRRAMGRAAVRVGAVLCVSLLVLIPWTIRNYMVFGKFVLVSTNGGMSLLTGNNPSMVGNYRINYAGRDPLVKQAQFSVKDQVAADQRARALAFRWIRDNPSKFLALIPQKVFRLWAIDGEGEWGYEDSPFYLNHKIWFRAARVANQCFYVAVLLLFIVGAWNLLQNRTQLIAFYGIAVIFVFTAISMIFSGQSRYHFPAMPFVFSYVAWILARFGVQGGNSDGVERRSTIELRRHPVLRTGVADISGSA